jgi:hypothetical protein
MRGYLTVFGSGLVAGNQQNKKNLHKRKVNRKFAMNDNLEI